MDAFQRRRDWEVAAFLVSLVVVPGVLDWFSGQHAPRPRSAVGSARARTVARTVRARHVRPPRSC
jgi:hypothetical protein